MSWPARRIPKDNKVWPSRQLIRSFYTGSVSDSVDRSLTGQIAKDGKLHCYHIEFALPSPFSLNLLGCLGSTATRTIGVASKLRGVNGGQAGDVDSVADFSTKSCRPPIPNGNWKKKSKTTKITHCHIT